ncbi:MAG: BlaI/MecI/CopY family transcriptional regulator [Rhodothermaceae bacterium]
MKSKKIKPTESEIEILKILWDKESATVKEVNEILNKIKPVGYTTTLKLMQIMHEKGILSRTQSGRSHIYTPEIEEKETRKFMMNKLMDTLFGGSAKEMVMQALGNHKPSKEELDEIRSLIDKMEKE